MKSVSAKEAFTGVADCRQCPVRQSMLFADLNEASFGLLHEPIEQQVFKAGAQIYAAGNAANSLFTIRSGLIKLTQLLPDGTERIVRLLRGTDVAGLEAMIGEGYQHNATVLRETEACRLPATAIKRLSVSNSRFFHELMGRWHQALSSADRWITEFSTGSARDRVVRFLLWLSEAEDSENCQLFSRDDLGAVLGLTTETVSRTMADLKRGGYLVEPQLNRFTCDVNALRRLVEPV